MVRLQLKIYLEKIGIFLLKFKKRKGKKIRQSILDNVDSMVHCRDFSYEYLFF